MKTFRVYKHPNKQVSMVVKVGFSWPAFIIGPLWFLLNKMWINFALVTTFIVSGNLYFKYYKPTTQSEALLFIGMYLLFLVTCFLIGKFANFLLCSDLEDQGYILKATVTAKNASHAREEAARTSQSNEAAAALTSATSGSASNSEEVQQNWIAGFWRRIGALFIDTLILGGIGFTLGLVLESTFVQFGGWGRFIGFGIALIYFGAMNSKLFEGQTIGKKLLKLKVVDSENHTIPLGRSTLRYIVLSTPFSLNGAHFSNEAMLSFLIYPLSLVIFGGLLSIIYLYLFNRVTRQSLHDLAVGTFVVNANIEKQGVGKVWKTHLIVIGIFFIAAAIVPAFTGKLAQSEPFKEMLAVQSALSGVPGVTYAAITTSTTFSSINKETKTTTYVNAQAFLSSNNVSNADFAQQLATIVVKNFPEAKNKDNLRITLTYGYDIGIWSQWSNHTHDFNPSEFANVE